MSKQREEIMFENARIVFRNFSGKPGKFNAAGQRNFCLLLSTDVAKELTEKGWNIRWFEPQEEGEPRQAYTQVRVSYTGRPPKIVMISSRGRVMLDEESIDILDWAEIQKLDMILVPYQWKAGGATGTKGYLKTMYVTIREDELELKYSNMPDSAASSLLDNGSPFQED